MITYRENHPLSEEQLLTLYDGWTAYTNHPDKMARLLPGALWHMSAWDGDKVVGFIRAVGDDCSILYIQDIMVLEPYQRRGIGKRLMQAAFERFSHIRQTVLMTDNEERTRAFYQACAMTTVQDTGCVCYVRYNLDK